MSQKKTLPPPEFPQENLDGKINIPDIKAMLTKYIMMRVNNYQGIEEIDTIEGEIHLKNDTKANVKSIPYSVFPDQVHYNFYTILFDIDKIDFSGLCEASYTITNLHQETLYSQTANITIIGETNMPNPDNEIIFIDAKKSILYLNEINIKNGIRVRAKFDDLAKDDDIIFTAKFFGDIEELFILKSINITLRVNDINNGYVDYTFDKNKINFAEVKSVIVKFSTSDDKIKSSYEEVSINNDLDTVNIKVQTTKNIADMDSDHPDIKPSLIAVVYTHLDNKPIMAHVTNAFFGNNDLNTTPLNDINKDGVAYLHIYSKDSSKNSVLMLNYEDPVIAHKVPLDFSTWQSAQADDFMYTYSSYGVADSTCQCFLLIKLINQVTNISVSFDSPEIKINGKNNILNISNPDITKLLVYELTSPKAVRSQFTIDIGDMSVGPTTNTIVFVDPLTL